MAVTLGVLIRRRGERAIALEKQRAKQKTAERFPARPYPLEQEESD